MSSEPKEIKEPKEETKAQDLNDVEIVIGANGSPKNAAKTELLFTNEKNHTHIRQPSRDFGKLAAELDGDKVQASQPLLEPDRGRQKPPLAGPEIDDLDGDDEKPAPTGNGHYPGIDDGLLDPPTEKPQDLPEDGDDEKQPEDGTRSQQSGDADGDGNWWQHDEPDHPLYGQGINGLDPKYGIDSRPGSPMMPGSIPDVNTYQQKKNLAQGMMDLALLSANANQLRYVVESASSHPYYYPSLTFISLSIALQIAVGVGLIMNSRYNVKNDQDICKADKINNMTILGIFLITIVNVFITSFSVAAPTVNVGTDVQNVG